MTRRVLRDEASGSHLIEARPPEGDIWNSRYFAPTPKAGTYAEIPLRAFHWNGAPDPFLVAARAERAPGRRVAVPSDTVTQVLELSDGGLTFARDIEGPLRFGGVLSEVPAGEAESILSGATLLGSPWDWSVKHAVKLESGRYLIAIETMIPGGLGRGDVEPQTRVFTLGEAGSAREYGYTQYSPETLESHMREWDFILSRSDRDPKKVAQYRELRDFWTRSNDGYGPGRSFFSAFPFGLVGIARNGDGIRTGALITSQGLGSQPLIATSFEPYGLSSRVSKLTPEELADAKKQLKLLGFRVESPA